MHDIKVNQQMIVLKHYNDDTFMKGKLNIDGWNRDEPAIHFGGDEFNMTGQVGYVTEVGEINSSKIFSVYFSNLDATDAFYFADLKKYDFNFKIHKYNQLWNNVLHG
jgi:hypothetical protein